MHTHAHAHTPQHMQERVGMQARLRGRLGVWGGGASHCLGGAGWVGGTFDRLVGRPGRWSSGASLSCASTQRCARLICAAGSAVWPFTSSVVRDRRGKARARMRAGPTYKRVQLCAPLFVFHNERVGSRAPPLYCNGCQVPKQKDGGGPLVPIQSTLPWRTWTVTWTASSARAVHSPEGREASPSSRLSAQSPYALHMCSKSLLCDVRC